jgi:hypothetical protein
MNDLFMVESLLTMTVIDIKPVNFITWFVAKRREGNNRVFSRGKSADGN